MIELELARAKVEKRLRRFDAVVESGAEDARLTQDELGRLIGLLCSGTDVAGPELARSLDEARCELLRDMLRAGPCDCEGSEEMILNCNATPLVLAMLNSVFWLGWECGRAES